MIGFLLPLILLFQSILYIPLLYLKARKFSLLFSLGSIMTLTAVSMIKGPTVLVKQV